MTVLVTGANGFVGRGVIARFARAGVSTRSAVREVGTGSVGQIAVGTIDVGTRWAGALEGVTTVVHLAARVHVMRDTAAYPLNEFRRTNVEGTIALARQAAAAGVRRLVFVSSIKVNGEAGTFRESDLPAPVDPYGLSKLEAEMRLREVSASTGLEVTIIRPPLVYGPGVKGNFRALMTAVARGIPLPLGAVHNRRSLVARDNLADFIVACAEHPRAAGETFLVSDGEDVSTTELVKRLARAMHRPARLLPVPPSLLAVAAAGLGKKQVAQRLIGTLRLDISRARSVLDWQPPIGLDEGLRRAVEES